MSTRIKIYLSILPVLLLITCGHDMNTLKPSIRFAAGEDYVNSNVIIAEGNKAMLGVYAVWDGDDLLSRLIINKNGVAVLDRAIGRSNLNFSMEIIKGAEIEENWEFVVMDEGDEQISASLILYRKAGITDFIAPHIGAQQSSLPLFYSVEHNKAYMPADALAKQDSVDILYYYNRFNSTSTLLSPANRIADTIYTGIKGPSSWKVRNTTLFLPVTVLDPGSFDTLSTDWFLKEAFSKNLSVWSNQSVFLEPDKMLFFRLASGEYGLIKVLTLDEGVGGSAGLRIKMQRFD